MCTTRVFSFGNQVVESQETQQAAFYGGRYVYSFKMVNEWFYTFLQTLNDGRSLDEAQASLRNIIILQVNYLQDWKINELWDHGLVKLIVRVSTGHSLCLF